MTISLEPTYVVAKLFPPQGQWSEEEYLALDTNRIVELSDGTLEVADLPTDLHQLLVARLVAALMVFVTQHRLGHVRPSALPVRLWPRKFREPDVVFMSAAHVSRITQQYWGVPDLAVEILSPSSLHLDRVIKRQEYAQAGILEYWIVDPDEQTVEVLLLEGSEYGAGQVLRAGDTLTSAQLPGFSLAVSDLFAEEYHL